MGRSNPARTGALCVGLLLAVPLAGCAQDAPTDPRADARAEAPLRSRNGDDLAALRRATARFHRLEVGRDAGYTTVVTHPVSGERCLADPQQGAMGIHFLDLSLADEAVAIAQPEVLIYEPRSNGELRLAGIEYLVPFAVRPASAEPPRLFGRDFKQNHTFGVWALHAWAWKHNPAGDFEDWNPTVTCEHDDAVGDLPA
ncbi:MAG: hypothetical protein ACRELV_07570 [Longimicrobiales bacterium]